MCSDFLLINSQCFGMFGLREYMWRSVVVYMLMTSIVREPKCRWSQWIRSISIHKRNKRDGPRKEEATTKARKKINHQNVESNRLFKINFYRWNSANGASMTTTAIDLICRKEQMIFTDLNFKLGNRHISKMNCDQNNFFLELNQIIRLC